MTGFRQQSWMSLVIAGRSGLTCDADVLVQKELCVKFRFSINIVVFRITAKNCDYTEKTICWLLLKLKFDRMNIVSKKDHQH